MTEDDERADRESTGGRYQHKAESQLIFRAEVRQIIAEIGDQQGVYRIQPRADDRSQGDQLRQKEDDQKEIFEKLIQNYSTKEIASNLLISEKTVRNHISNVMQKLGVKGRASAVVELLRLEEVNI